MERSLGSKKQIMNFILQFIIIPGIGGAIAAEFLVWRQLRRKKKREQQENNNK